MAARPTYLILGGGLAGHAAAETLRALGFDGRVVLVAAEPEPPYERPPLSKGFLQGKTPLERVFLATPERYAQIDVDLLLATRAVAVDLAARRVALSSGEALGFDKLLIATGATPVRLDLPGFDLPGVHTLRTLADARAIRADLERAERVLVVGAGFIGAEVAASARLLGKAVTLVDVLDAPLAAALGERIGRIYARIHARHGVDLRMGTRVVALRGSGRVEEAVLAGGERIACQAVVVGVGVRPEVSLFAEAGLALDNGIAVDERCRTSAPGVYAAGDVASWWHPALQRRIRVEHFDNAALQGAAAAREMLGQGAPYAPVPYFWSDQYDVNLQFAGYTGPYEASVERGDPEAPALTVFYLSGGLVRAAVTVNRPRDLRPARKLIEAGARLDPAALGDEAVDLRALARQAAP